MKNKFVFFLIIITLFTWSCNTGKEFKFQADVSEIQKSEVIINRYEQDIFNVDKNDLLTDLQKLSIKYPLFIESNLDTLKLIQLIQYLEDPLIIELKEDVNKIYPDLKFLESQFTEINQYLKYYFPTEKEKTVYTYISGIDVKQPIFINESNIIISLDLYLGAEYPAYKQMGIPIYKSLFFDKKSIITDVLYEDAFSRMNNSFHPKTLLDFMIEAAKPILFTDLMLPYVADSLKIKYTNEQLNWCETNESNIWAFFIENQLLFNTDQENVKKLILDAPYSSGFDETSPGRLGIWVGWQILNSYLDKNPETDLTTLMKNNNSQEILKKSGYRPDY